MNFIAKKLVRFVEFLERHTPKSFHVFHIEDIFVALVLIGTALFFGENYIEWIGVLAVFMAFKHTVVAFRLEDTVQTMERHAHISHPKNRQAQLFYTKEILWFIYFVLLGAWSALVGVILFLLYPFWHKARKKYHTGTKHKQEVIKG